MTKVTRLTLDNEGGLDRKRIHLREISDELDAPLDTVGQDLRTARLRRGDDLASVSRVLKIRKDHHADRIGAGQKWAQTALLTISQLRAAVLTSNQS